MLFSHHWLLEELIFDYLLLKAIRWLFLTFFLANISQAGLILLCECSKNTDFKIIIFISLEHSILWLGNHHFVIAWPLCLANAN